MQITYVGFVQSGSIRSFNFEAKPEIRSGLRFKPILLSITADMGIVNRCRLKIQDLPALCQRTISTAVETRGESQEAPLSFVLTEEAVRAHCAAILLNPVRADHRKRPHPKPPESSQLQWVKRV